MSVLAMVVNVQDSSWSVIMVSSRTQRTGLLWDHLRVMSAPLRASALHASLAQAFSCKAKLQKQPKFGPAEVKGTRGFERFLLMLALCVLTLCRMLLNVVIETCWFCQEPLLIQLNAPSWHFLIQTVASILKFAKRDQIADVYQSRKNVQCRSIQKQFSTHFKKLRT